VYSLSETAKPIKYLSNNKKKPYSKKSFMDKYNTHHSFPAVPFPSSKRSSTPTPTTDSTPNKS
jgi:hypothetical protein